MLVVVLVPPRGTWKRREVRVVVVLFNLEEWNAGDDWTSGVFRVNSVIHREAAVMNIVGDLLMVLLE